MLMLSMIVSWHDMRKTKRAFCAVSRINKAPYYGAGHYKEKQYSRQQLFNGSTASKSAVEVSS